jgi:scyllo-inositol 2-dehydrogenase (NADP+)
MDKPQTAVIGYGFAGKSFHSYLIGLADGLHLRGVCSRSAETRDRIVAERGCQAYETFESVLEDPAVDLVVLATPNSTHCDMAIAAMDAGKNVVTDKVACLNLDECDRMMAAAARNDVMLSVFQNRRWDGDFLTLRQAIADGTLGSVRWAEMAWQGFGAWGGWRGQAAAGGGKLYDLGAHIIDQLCLLFPQPIDSVYAKLHHDWPQTDTESQALVVINFADGCTGICDTSSMAAISKPRMHVFGDGGTFVKFGVDPQEQAMIKGDIDSAVEAPANYPRVHDGKGETVLTPIPGRWRNYYENIADVLTGKAEPAIRMSEVHRAISVIEAAFKSAETGTAIKVDG